MSNEEAGREAAQNFRAEFRLGHRPLPNLPRLIEQTMGIGVACVAVDAPGHGMTMRLGTRYLMAAGCTDHPMRLRSTLAHELGHVRLNSVECYVDHGTWTKRTPEEIQADAFARHLLVPLDAVEAETHGSEPTLKLLSSLVQHYKASPQIVAIQLREADIIDANSCTEWGELTSGQLASTFGWHAEYEALAVQSHTPRPPQTLMARTIEAFRWGVVTPAVVARLEGSDDPQAAAKRLADAGITPTNEDFTADRPEPTGRELTPEELALLGDGSE